VKNPSSRPARSPTPCRPDGATVPAGRGDLPLIGDGARGRLRLAGQDYLLIRPETLAPLCRSRDAAVHDLLEAGGREGGALAAAAVLAAGSTGRVALEELCTAGGRIGWGRFQVVLWEPGRVVVEVENSPFAQGGSGSAAPTCHLTAGVLAGMLAQILGTSVKARETACAAGGAERCRFDLAESGPVEPTR